MSAATASYNMPDGQDANELFSGLFSGVLPLP